MQEELHIPDYTLFCVGLHIGVLLKRRLNVNNSIPALLPKPSNDFIVLAGCFAHLIMTNTENVLGDGKCSAELQATE